MAFLDSSEGGEQLFFNALLHATTNIIGWRWQWSEYKAFCINHIFSIIFTSELPGGGRKKKMKIFQNGRDLL